MTFYKWRFTWKRLGRVTRDEGKLSSWAHVFHTLKFKLAMCQSKQIFQGFKIELEEYFVLE